MPSTLILGGTGMLGHKVFQHLAAAGHDVSCTVRDTADAELLGRVPFLAGNNVIPAVDVTDLDALSGVIGNLRPATVVNCVGIIKQRPAAGDAIASITANALFPHLLLEICTGVGARLIHFSTDCVFDGEQGGYAESDAAAPLDVYGRTKLLGEVTEGNALTLRTSIIGRELSGFRGLVEWFLSQQAGSTVFGYRRAIYSGLTTIRMADVVRRLIEEDPGLSGLYHVAGPVINKYDLLLLLCDSFGREVDIEPSDEVAVDRSLRADRFTAETGYTPPGWPEMIAEMADDPTPYESWRP